jgi:hypothetical protein
MVSTSSRPAGTRVAATHLDATGKAAILERWAEHRARRDYLRLQAEVERAMRAVTYTLKYGPAPTAPAARATWVCPLINTGAAL